MKQEFKIISSLINENSKILDVGCGNGELMKYILENISKKYKRFGNIKKKCSRVYRKGFNSY